MRGILRDINETLTTYIAFMLKSLEFIFDSIFKGFGLVTTTVTNPAFAEYDESFQPWIESAGGSVFAKYLDGKTVKGKVRNYK